MSGMIKAETENEELVADDGGQGLRLTLARRFGAGRFTLDDLWAWTGSSANPSRVWRDGTREKLYGCPGVVEAPGPAGGEGWRVSWPALVEMAGGKPLKVSGYERCPFTAHSKMRRESDDHASISPHRPVRNRRMAAS